MSYKGGLKDLSGQLADPGSVLWCAGSAFYSQKLHPCPPNYWVDVRKLNLSYQDMGM